MDRMEGMMESKVDLLTRKRIPGKLSYASIYFLDSYYDLKNLVCCTNKQNVWDWAEGNHTPT